MCSNIEVIRYSNTGIIRIGLINIFPSAKKKIPESLDSKITSAAKKHQEIFTELENKITEKDKGTFQVANKFFEINYRFIVYLRNSKAKEKNIKN